MRETAKVAADNGFDYFTTTLSISPHKNAVWLNEIGERLGKEFGVKYLYADFKKQNGEIIGKQIRAKYDLYDQQYCGCKYSYEDYQRRLKENGGA